MPRIEATIVIDRAPEDVWALAEDHERKALFQPTALEREVLTPRLVGKGSRLRYADRMVGRRVEYVTEITEWDPPRRSGARTVSGPRRVESWATYEPVGEATRVTQTADMEDIGGILGRLVQPLFRRVATRQLKASLKRLKRVLEAGD